MQFRIADTFTDSLGKLTGDEQKSVKTTAFDLQLNPANPGMQFHKLNKAKDKNFWSVRVSSDIRLIVHKTDASLLLCYVGHHDAAYNWAERRKLETHPKTGAAQLVEIRETVKEITIPKFVEVEEPVPLQQSLFDHLSEEDLLSFGVPTDWVDDVRLANEESLFEVADHLPKEAAEALLELATGGTPVAQQPATAAPSDLSDLEISFSLDEGPLFEVADRVPKGKDEAMPKVAPGGIPVVPQPIPVSAFEHPDAQRRFRLMPDAAELERALDYPWEKWAIFLHPAQRDLVERNYNGPARVAGSAGTGKTVVALHRAAYLARAHEDARVLVATFSNPLAKALESKLRRLLGNRPKLYERIEVYSFDELGKRLYVNRIGKPQLASEDLLRELLAETAREQESQKFSERFLWAEWNDVVDAWQLNSWEAYRDVARLGRKTRIGEQQRRNLWDIFKRVHHLIGERSLLTKASLFARVTENLQKNQTLPFDFCIIDEAQDIGVPELRLLAALGAEKPSALFFAGDLGQRIFQPPFSWKSLGVDVRGRSRTLRINYRTSHQIRSQADRLLPPEMADVDGNREERRGTISAFNGPKPIVQVFNSYQEESIAVSNWITGLVQKGLLPEEIAIFVRSADQFPRVQAAIEAIGLERVELEQAVKSREGAVSVLAMHLAKGLEFRAVVVMACDDEILPLHDRISTVGDDADLEEVYNTERHLLYVACTRARDHLLVSGVEPASEFLDDLSVTSYSKEGGD